MTGSTSGSKIPAGYKQGQMQNFTPEQMQLFKGMFSQLGPDSYLSKLAGGDQSMFDEMEKPAMKQFGEMQGQMASRFSGMGMGSRRGSGFQNSMTQGAADFAESLQSKRMEMRNQALQDLMGFSNQLLGQKPYEKFLIEKQQKSSGWGGALGAAGGAGLGFLAGGPMGALKGAGVGYNVGSAF